MNGLLTLDGTLWLIMLRTAIVYIALLLGLRAFGKRELGQLSTFDLALLLLIANTVQNAMTGPDSSVNGGLLAAFVLMGLSYLLSTLGWHSHLFKRIIIGVPTVLVTNGKVIATALRREDITNAELEGALRAHNLKSVQDVALAVLEIDGSISVIPKGETAVATIAAPKTTQTKKNGYEQP